jgi:hypothetical protein
MIWGLLACCFVALLVVVFVPNKITAFIYCALVIATTGVFVYDITHQTTKIEIIVEKNKIINEEVVCLK